MANENGADYSSDDAGHYSDKPQAFPSECSSLRGCRRLCLKQGARARFRAADLISEYGKKLASESELRILWSLGARPIIESVRQYFQHAVFCVGADYVAVYDFADRSASRSFRRDMNGRRHFARRAGHPPVRDKRHSPAAIKQNGQGRGQAVQFRHAVGRRALETDDDDAVFVQFAILEGLLH